MFLEQVNCGGVKNLMRANGVTNAEIRQLEKQHTLIKSENTLELLNKDLDLTGKSWAQTCA